MFLIRGTAALRLLKKIVHKKKKRISQPDQKKSLWMWKRLETSCERSDLVVIGNKTIIWL